MRVGQRRLCTIGLLVGAVGMAMFVTLDAHSSYWQFLVGMLVLSVGIGLAMTPATAAIVNSLPLAKQGVASAVNDTSREVGGALGVAVLGSAFNTAYRDCPAGVRVGIASRGPHLRGTLRARRPLHVVAGPGPVAGIAPAGRRRRHNVGERGMI